MLKKIKTQINEIETILSGITEYKNIDKYLKENKYAKKITEKYFKLEDKIIETIKKHQELVKELKVNHIKLTENQKSLEQKHKKYIEELNRTLNSTLKLLKKLEEEKTYIDQEIINILDFNEIDDLKNIIEFNKTILLKKQGYIQNESKEEEKKIETKPVKEKKPVKQQKLVQKESDTINKKEEKSEKETIKEPEIILLYNSIEELNKYLKKQYNIEIETETSIEKLNEMIEIIENSSIKDIETNLIKEILEKGNLKRLKEVARSLEETDIEAKDVAHIKGEFICLEKEQTIVEYIILYPHLSKQKKLEILNKPEARREKFVKNSNFCASYGIDIKNINAILSEISIEKIDQLIEVGCYAELLYVTTLFDKNFSPLGNTQFEYYLAKTRYQNIYEYFFSGIIYDLVVEIEEKTFDTSKLKENIYKKLKQDPKYKPKLLMGMPELRQLTSKNEILYRESKTSKDSLDNFLFTLNLYHSKGGNIIYQQNNKYLQLIDDIYSKKYKITYDIPINKKFAKSGVIHISKPKVLRLLNQYTYEGKEITKEVVKQCMLYNLITTDEILNELDRILTEQFDLIDQKIKKY